MKFTPISFILVYFFIGFHLKIAAQNIVWQKIYGGYEYEHFRKIVSTHDGGFLLCGNSFSGANGNKTTPNFEPSLSTPDIWIVKINSLGIILWQKSYGGIHYDNVEDVKQTKDNGFIIGGWSGSGISGNKTEPHFGGYDYWVIKIDSLGNIEWQNTIGGYGFDQLSSIIQTTDGGYFVGGYSESSIGGDKTESRYGNSIDYWVLKLDAIGNIMWQKTIGGYGTDFLLSICATNDNGYILAGWSDSPIGGDKIDPCSGNADYWIIKINDLGNILWQKTFGGDKYDECNQVSITNQDNIFISGRSLSGITGNKTINNWDSSLTTDDYWSLLLDRNGLIIWQQVFGGVSRDGSTNSKALSNNQFIIGGGSQSGISGNKTDSLRGIQDYCYVILDINGSIIEQKTIGGSDQDLLMDIDTTINGQFILGGQSSSNISCEKTSTSFGNTTDYWVLLIDRQSVDVIENFKDKSQYTIYPNPCKNFLFLNKVEQTNNFNIEVYDLTGRIILKENLRSNKIDVSKLQKGYYILKINSSEEPSTIKFIKE